MARHIVIGSGPIGAATAALLTEQGREVTVLTRSGGAGRTALDVTDTTALRKAADGAEVIYNCASPAYHRWPTDWPPIADSVLDAAEATGAVLVMMGNLYAYGPADRPFTESHPLAGTERCCVKCSARFGCWWVCWAPGSYEVEVVVLGDACVDPSVVDGSGARLGDRHGGRLVLGCGDLLAEVLLAVVGVERRELDQVAEVFSTDVFGSVEHNEVARGFRSDLDPADAGLLRRACGAEELLDGAPSSQGTEGEGFGQVAHVTSVEGSLRRPGSGPWSRYGSASRERSWSSAPRGRYANGCRS